MKENRLVNRNWKRGKTNANNQKKKKYYTFNNFLSVCDNLQQWRSQKFMLGGGGKIKRQDWK